VNLWVIIFVCSSYIKTEKPKKNLKNLKNSKSLKLFLKTRFFQPSSLAEIIVFLRNKLLISKPVKTARYQL